MTVIYRMLHNGRHKYCTMFWLPTWKNYEHTHSISLCNVGSKNENIDRKSEKKRERLVPLYN